jgi:hypothetical protein
VFEHTIELEEGAKPMITPPYFHPRSFKDEIEKVIKEFLAMGHIRPSSSPFASLVVLVINKDGTMRMCINYQALNKKTIKNWYPIACIGDFMDELHGAIFFSKIDLRYGYHQINIREKDIEKMTFICHFGHFEFLVMPFGLTNTSTTFQSRMKHIFRDQLRKSVLVFFNDILVYNKTWHEHMRELDEVLSIMETQSLYPKKSKCEFSTRKILWATLSVHRGYKCTRKDQGHSGLDNAHEHDRVEDILWDMHLLHAVCRGFFLAWITTYRSHLTWGLHLD